MDKSKTMHTWRFGLPTDANALGMMEKDLRWFFKSCRAWFVSRKDGSREMPSEYWTDELLVRVSGWKRLFYFALIIRSGSRGRCARLLSSGEWVPGTKVFALTPRSAFDYVLRHGGLLPEDLPKLLHKHFSSYDWYQEIVTTPTHSWLYYDVRRGAVNDNRLASTPVEIMEKFAHVGMADAMRKYLENSGDPNRPANEFPQPVSTELD